MRYFDWGCWYGGERVEAAWIVVVGWMSLSLSSSLHWLVS